MMHTSLYSMQMPSLVTCRMPAELTGLISTMSIAEVSLCRSHTCATP